MNPTADPPPENPTAHDPLISAEGNTTETEDIIAENTNLNTRPKRARQPPLRFRCI